MPQRRHEHAGAWSDVVGAFGGQRASIIDMSGLCCGVSNSQARS
jgi:hypothetical protein